MEWFWVKLLGTKTLKKEKFNKKLYTKLMKAFTAYITFLIVLIFVVYGFYSVGVIYEKGLYCSNCSNSLQTDKIEQFIYTIKSILLYLPFLIYGKLENLKITNDPYFNTSINLFISLFLNFTLLAAFYYLFKIVFSYFIKEKPKNLN